MIETHKIYPIGLLDDGDVYYVEVSHGRAVWAKLYAEFDIFGEDEQPTLKDEEVQRLLATRERDEWIFKVPDDFIPSLEIVEVAELYIR